MKSKLLVLFLLAPAILFGQSLAEVARREKERRDKNKKEGKEVHVISESDVRPAEGSPAESGGTAAPAPYSPAAGGYSSELDEEDGGEEEDVPDSIPPSAPLPEKLELYERMKRGYQREAAAIDEELGKNEARLREIESELAVASASGGAGLPVAPQAGAANRQMTGQESAVLVGQQNQLLAENDRLRQRKEQLKLEVQQKGRAGGIPPGYLRF